MTTSNAVPWPPPYCSEVQTLPAGRWWDAVRVPHAVGALALASLGRESGPVIQDGYGGIFYWLVRPGGADGWRLPEVRVLGRSSYVAVPPQRRWHGPGLFWRVPLAGGPYLTRVERLYTAVREAVADACGARLSHARNCCRCRRSTEAAVLVRTFQTRGGSVLEEHACPDCAPHCATGPGRMEGGSPRLGVD